MTVCITGAASGIGLALAQHFAARGAALALFDRAADPLADIAQHLTGARAYPLDVTDEASVTQAMAQARAELGPARILINAAGIASGGPALNLPMEVWRRVLDVNLTGTFLCARTAARQMIDAGTGGRILNFASALALAASANRVAYGTSKAAVIALTRQLAVEWGPHGITVNALAPGLIETPMTAPLGTAFRAAYGARTPAGRTGETGDVVAAAAYLTSAQAGHVTGQALAIDGGFSVFGMPDCDAPIPMTRSDEPA